MSMMSATTMSRMQQAMLEAMTASAPESAADEPRADHTSTFASALKESTQGAGWDPKEVWLTRVHRPRAGRRAW